MRSLDFDQLVGQTIQSCRVEQLLSCGRVSAVYRAHQLRPNRPVAVTLFLVPDSLPGQPSSIVESICQQFRERFLRDGPALLALRHPNLLPLYGYGEWEGLPFLITPYRSEGSLATTLRQRGAYTPASIVPVLEEVAAGLEYAHRNGQVHGMLSPAHLLISEDRPLQIAGLGLLRLLERRGLLPVSARDGLAPSGHPLGWPHEAVEHSLTITGAPLVARRYLSPEYLQGWPADIRSDVYALGVVLVELLAGRLLPDDIPPLDFLAEMRTRHHPSLEQVLRQALAPDPAMRFRRVGNLLTAWAVAVEREEETQERIQWSRPLPAVEAMPLPTFGKEQVDIAFLSDPIPWQRTPTAQLALPSRQTMKRYIARTWSAGKVSRRDVTALLVGGVAVGVIGSAGIGLAKLLSARPGAQTTTGPAHTASVIGTTQLALNSALPFNNPGATDHRQSLLVHLPDGTFVAYKQGCTHSGVLVNYDPKTHMLVCPAHGAIFDPAQAGRVVSGPTSVALPQLSIHVGSDGTIIKS